MAQIHGAVRRGSYEETSACISRGDDIDALSIRSFTPLMIAVETQHVAIINLLLESGAQVNLTSANGRSALHFAASKGDLRIVRTLVQYGADVNIVSKFRLTPMISAAMMLHHDVVLFLKDQGADADYRGREGLTADAWIALGGVAGQGRKLFSEHFANPDNPNERRLASEKVDENMRKRMAGGISPEEYAAKHGRNILVFSYGNYKFRDSEVETWTQRLAELLRNPGLMEDCEEKYLSGEELEKARLFRARCERRKAREEKKKARMLLER